MRQIAEVLAKKPKDPYNPPRLFSYGDLTAMTNGRFAGVNPDNASKKKAGKT
jgi:hypothetical protein